MSGRASGWWMASDGRWYPPHLHPSQREASAVEPVPSRATTSAPVVPAHVDVAHPVTAGGPARRARRRRLRRAAIVCVVVVIAGVLAYVTVASNHSPTVKLLSPRVSGPAAPSATATSAPSDAGSASAPAEFASPTNPPTTVASPPTTTPRPTTPPTTAPSCATGVDPATGACEPPCPSGEYRTTTGACAPPLLSPTSGGSGGDGGGGGVPASPGKISPPRLPGG